VRGYVSLQNIDREHAFSDSDVRLLGTLANSMSVALENARLFSETEQRNAELAVINSVQEGLVREMEMEAIYSLVGDRICDVLKTRTLLVRTFDLESGLENWDYAIENGVRLFSEPRPIMWANRYLMENRIPLVVNSNYIETAKKHGGSGVSKGLPPKSAIFVPMVVGDHVIGSISLQNVDRENAFSDSDVRLLTTLSNSISVALENARLFSETNRLLAESQQRTTELQTVNRISHALVSQLELDALLHLVGELMKETFKADIVYLAMYDRQTDMIRFPYEYGDKNPPRKFGDGFTERIITSNEPLLINKGIDEIREQLKARRIGRVTASFLGVPVTVGSQPIGVISVQSTEEENRFNENDLRLLSTIAANVSVAIQNAEAYSKLRSALEDLKAVQEQLVQQEKLASLGQLTAGIAHEIKNPLNFVNNFSELSQELLDELREEVLKKADDPDYINDLLNDISDNLKKIHHHGTRADGIVKSMLQHSRGGSGKMVPTDLSEVIKEYVNLAFHGMRAGKHPINVDIDLQLDEQVGEVPMITEDFSRVLLNLCNNAFDAMRDKYTESDGKSYMPKLTVRTRKNGEAVDVEIEDNGPGIPDEIRDKILQPFFTTKKGTMGTGLGLSITNDIIKAHGGTMKIQTNEMQGTKFIITLNLNLNQNRALS
jgi:signal transduction histidine kinase